MILPKLVFTDIDGVWTDGGMYYTAQGDAMKRFSVSDGWGVSFLRRNGIETAIITGENTPIVTAENRDVPHRDIRQEKKSRRDMREVRHIVV